MLLVCSSFCIYITYIIYFCILLYSVYTCVFCTYLGLCRGEVNPQNGIEMTPRDPPAWVLENSPASATPEPECTELEETKVDYEERFI